MLARVILGIAGVTVMVAGLSVVPAQAVNCKFVMKNLSTGRTAEEISETMMISIDEVKKCEAEAAAEKAAGGAAGGEKKADDAGK
jgi:hypothetical protein